jgi:multimeric flavodoxin WrbA
MTTPGRGTSQAPEVRKGQGSVQLTREQFIARLGERFYDPGFDAVREEIARVIDVAWTNYVEYHKSPRTRQAGPGFADPDYELPLEWLATRDAIEKAQLRQSNPASPSRILLICGSSRSDETCPGEMSKSFRLLKLAHQVVEETGGFECDVLDMSNLTAEYGRQILPCKACVATAMPLCHWPCSCYPNHAMGQVNDWMNELYPRWVAAHGVMIVTSVNWYHVPSALKLMIDRLVCADGGNPDPTSTHGKKPEEAKALELKGWSYPKHLAGRAFALAVHGDVGGGEMTRRALTDWLSWMGLVQAGRESTIDRYIGYYEPYATSHDALDRDTAVQEEVRNVARSLVRTVQLIREGKYQAPDAGLKDPRPK